MRFTKMNGAGNDFILLDAIAEPFDESAASALARSLCDRRRSIGADGLMLVTRAEGDADYRMRFYNSDGSPGEMCGNGARCICRYGYARGYAGPIQRVETTAGLVTGWRITEDQYRIRLNTPSVVELEKQLTVDGRTYRCSYVELGSPGIPHLALEMPALAEQDEDALRRLGRTLRYHPALPKGANINFYELTLRCRRNQAVIYLISDDLRCIQKLSCLCFRYNIIFIYIVPTGQFITGYTLFIKFRHQLNLIPIFHL